MSALELVAQAIISFSTPGDYFDNVYIPIDRSFSNPFLAGERDWPKFFCNTYDVFELTLLLGVMLY